MKLSIKKALSLALACTMALTGLGVAEMAGAAKNKRAVHIPAGKIQIQADAKKEVKASTTVSGVAISTKGALTCSYDAKLASSIASASAVAASGNAVTVTVTATKSAVAVTDAAVAVLSNNATVASVLVTIKGVPETKELRQTKSISIQDKIVIAPGKTKVVAFTAKKTKAANRIKTVKVSSANTKVVEAKKVPNKKLVELTVPAEAVRGSSAVVTLKSGKKTASIKVYVKNKAKKVRAIKRVVTVKKGKKASVQLAVTAQNKKKATTDTISTKVTKSKLAKVTKTAAKKGKVVVTVKGKKKGTGKMTVKVGNKTAKVTVRVR